MLFRNEKDALEIVRVSLACEPPYEDESIVMANALINSAPIVIGITDKRARAKVAKLGYRLARALLGHDTADRLRFPKYATLGLLPYLRTMRRLRHFMRRSSPRASSSMRLTNFGALLDATVLEDSSGGFSYNLPDHYVADRAAKW